MCLIGSLTNDRVRGSIPDPKCRSGSVVALLCECDVYERQIVRHIKTLYLVCSFKRNCSCDQLELMFVIMDCNPVLLCCPSVCALYVSLSNINYGQISFKDIKGVFSPIF